MLIYENGSNDYGKQITDYKGYISEIKYEITHASDLNDEVTILSDIHHGYYDTNSVRYMNDLNEQLEFTGTSPMLVEICILALFNREVILQLDYYHQRLFIKSDDLDVLDVCRVKTYFYRIRLPYPITSEIQKEILTGSRLL
jgi:hypothetical protein